MKTKLIIIIHFCLTIILIMGIIKINKQNVLLKKELVKQQTEVETTNNKLAELCNEIIVLENKLKETKEEMLIYKITEYINKNRSNLIRPSVIRKIVDVHRDFDFDLSLVLALIQQESNFNPNARSSVAYGLTQVHYGVWRKQFRGMTREKLYNIDYNLRIGLEILTLYNDKYNLETALFVYNNGESGKYNNTRYAKNIINNKRQYDNVISEVFR